MGDVLNENGDLGYHQFTGKGAKAKHQSAIMKKPDQFAQDDDRKKFQDRVIEQLQNQAEEKIQKTDAIIEEVEKKTGPDEEHERAFEMLNSIYEEMLRLDKEEKNQKAQLLEMEGNLENVKNDIYAYKNELVGKKNYQQRLQEKWPDLQEAWIAADKKEKEYEPEVAEWTQKEKNGELNYVTKKWYKHKLSVLKGYRKTREDLEAEIIKSQDTQNALVVEIPHLEALIPSLEGRVTRLESEIENQKKQVMEAAETNKNYTYANSGAFAQEGWFFTAHYARLEKEKLKKEKQEQQEKKEAITDQVLNAGVISVATKDLKSTVNAMYVNGKMMLDAEDIAGKNNKSADEIRQETDAGKYVDKEEVKIRTEEQKIISQMKEREVFQNINSDNLMEYMAYDEEQGDFIIEELAKAEEMSAEERKREYKQIMDQMKGEHNEAALDALNYENIKNLPGNQNRNEDQETSAYSFIPIVNLIAGQMQLLENSKKKEKAGTFDNREISASVLERAREIKRVAEWLPDDSALTEPMTEFSMYWQGLGGMLMDVGKIGWGVVEGMIGKSQQDAINEAEETGNSSKLNGKDGQRTDQVMAGIGLGGMGLGTFIPLKVFQESGIGFMPHLLEENVKWAGVTWLNGGAAAFVSPIAVITSLVNMEKGLMQFLEANDDRSRQREDAQKMRSSGKNRFGNVLDSAATQSKVKQLEGGTDAVMAAAGVVSSVLGVAGLLVTGISTGIGIGVKKIGEHIIRSGHKDDIINSPQVLGGINYDKNLIKEDYFNSIFTHVTGVNTPDDYASAIMVADGIDMHRAMRASIVKPNRDTDAVMSSLGFSDRSLYKNIKLQHVLKVMGIDEDFRTALRNAIEIKGVDYDTSWTKWVKAHSKMDMFGIRLSEDHYKKKNVRHSMEEMAQMRMEKRAKA